MTSATYLDLTSRLTTYYIGSIASDPQKTKESHLTKLHQWTVEDDGKPIVTLNVSELNEDLILINFISPSNQVESVIIQWGVDLPRVDLPVDEINMSNDLITKFNNFVKSKTKHDELSERFPVSQKSIPEQRQSPVKALSDHNQDPQPVPSAVYNEVPRPGRIPDMPDFEDELEIQRSMNPNRRGNAFPSIGDRDRNPPGMMPFHDPLANPGNDGGMYPSLDHPLFGSRQPGGSGSRRGVPPGARYDDPLSEDNLDALGSGLPGGLRSNQPNNGQFPGRSGGGFGFPGDGGFI